MQYKSPRRLLADLAQTGPSATRMQALRLLTPDVPDHWPEIERGSRESLLRQLAANTKKSAKSRIEALSELLDVMRQSRRGSEQEEIDAILREAARELNVPLSKSVSARLNCQGRPDPKQNADLPAQKENEPLRAPSAVPQDEVLNAPAIAEPQPDNSLLQRGRELAAAILTQHERLTRCPHNAQEGRALDRLQVQWIEFEREASTAGFDLAEFAEKLKWLRPAPRRPLSLDEKPSLSVVELATLPKIAKAAKVDTNSVGGSSLWDIGY